MINHVSKDNYFDLVNKDKNEESMIGDSPITESSKVED
jgi:hypothetical protein